MVRFVDGDVVNASVLVTHDKKVYDERFGTRFLRVPAVGLLLFLTSLGVVACRFPNPICQRGVVWVDLS